MRDDLLTKSSITIHNKFSMLGNNLGSKVRIKSTTASTT